MEMIRPSEDIDFARDLCMLPFARIADAFLLQQSINFWQDIRL
jgi:hypothetical protein